MQPVSPNDPTRVISGGSATTSTQGTYPGQMYYNLPPPPTYQTLDAAKDYSHQSWSSYDGHNRGADSADSVYPGMPRPHSHKGPKYYPAQESHDRFSKDAGEHLWDPDHSAMANFETPTPIPRSHHHPHYEDSGRRRVTELLVHSGGDLGYNSGNSAHSCANAGARVRFEDDCYGKSGGEKRAEGSLPFQGRSTG